MSAQPFGPPTDGEEPRYTAQDLARADELLDLFGRREQIVEQVSAALTTSLYELTRVRDAERELSQLPPGVLRAAVDARRARHLRELER